MNRTITLFLVLAMGFLGGLLSPLVISTPVHAQGTRGDAKEIRAQSFTLVDGDNRVVGTFKPSVELQGKKMDVVLLDQNGREIWRAGGGMALRSLDAR